MMGAYLLTPLADTDLEDIWRYIAEKSGDRVADRIEDELHAAMERVASAPGIGHLRSDLADESLRILPVHTYLIVYREKTSPVQVVRVLHGARDLRAIIETEP